MILLKIIKNIKFYIIILVFVTCLGCSVSAKDVQQRLKLDNVPKIIQDTFLKLEKIQTYEVNKIITKKDGMQTIEKISYIKDPYRMIKEYKEQGNNIIEFIDASSRLTVVLNKKYVFVNIKENLPVSPEQFLLSLFKTSYFTGPNIINFNGEKKECIIFVHSFKVPKSYNDNKKIVFQTEYFFDTKTGSLLKIIDKNMDGNVLKTEVFKNYKLNLPLDEKDFIFEIPSDFKIIHMTPQDKTNKPDVLAKRKRGRVT